jgi:vacuolar-type H+-ATPase subunit E/Vma4
MAGNSRTTLGKRQKERARQEKRAEKAQRKAQRKLEKQSQLPQEKSKDPVITYDEEGLPEGLGFHDF